MTALTREELLDVDPVHPGLQCGLKCDEARHIALRHAWNFAVFAEYAENRNEAASNASVSQAWSSIAEVLK